MMGSKRLFGLEFFESDMDAKDLPVYLTARRSFFRMSCSGIEFILIKVRDDERFGVAALEKQITTIAEKYGIPVAFGFANISKNQRDSLIGRNIPFISESGQIYLPFLCIALHDRFVSTKTINRQKMMPVTQVLFLYLLYFGKNGSVLKKDAAEAIGVTKTSITRASDQLEAMGLIKFDLLGLKNLSLIDNIVSQIRKTTDFNVNASVSGGTLDIRLFGRVDTITSPKLLALWEKVSAGSIGSRT